MAGQPQAAAPPEASPPPAPLLFTPAQQAIARDLKWVGLLWGGIALVLLVVWLVWR